MKHIGAVIGSKAHRDMKQVLRIREKWVDIAGEVLAAHCEPVSMRGGTLQLICDNPAWVQQLGIFSPTLMLRIKEEVGVKVNKLDGRFGMKHAAAPAAPPRPRPPLPDIDPQAVARLKNPELRKIVEDMMRGDSNE